MNWLRMIAAALAAGSLAAGAQAASGAEGPNDLRDFRIGMALSELPEEGYGEFSCAETGAPLTAWDEFTTCPVDGEGLREIRFAYTATRVEFVKANFKWGGTRVFGHPSIVSLLMEEDGSVAGIRISTDPSSSPYMRKKAFLLGQRAKVHFSPDTWRCEHGEPSNGETPVGGVYVKDRCENRFDDRLVKLEIDLFRTPGQSVKEYVNATRIEIRGAD